jgi:hypothetical protein
MMIIIVDWSKGKQKETVTRTRKKGKKGKKGVGRDGTEVGLGWSPVILFSSIIDSPSPVDRDQRTNTHKHLKDFHLSN